VGGSGQCAEGNKEFERGHGSSLSWSCAIFIDLMKRFSKLKSDTTPANAKKDLGQIGKLSRCHREQARLYV
jgi:hypothetical protein